MSIILNHPGVQYNEHTREMCVALDLCDRFDQINPLYLRYFDQGEPHYDLLREIFAEPTTDDHTGNMEDATDARVNLGRDYINSIVVGDSDASRTSFHNQSVHLHTLSPIRSRREGDAHHDAPYVTPPHDADHNQNDNASVDGQATIWSGILPNTRRQRASGSTSTSEVSTARCKPRTILSP